MIENKRLSSTLIFAFSLLCVFSQEFTPIVNHFNKTEYRAANQNWAVGQGADGMMYFGNNNGLLQFDGSEWELHKMPQNKIVRSILVVGELIYVGSYEEFGFFKKNFKGQLDYTSLSDSLKNYKMMNDEIWTISSVNNQIIFQSFTSYFSFHNNEVQGYRLPFTFLFFSVYNNKIFTYTEQTGFSRFNIQKRLPESISNNQLYSPVISVLKFDPLRALVVTKSSGLYLYDGNKTIPFKTEADGEIKKAEINRALITNDGKIILGTILNGVTAIDKRGKQLWTLNTSNILQNNTVLGMLTDKDDNLWLALDKGIAFIRLNSSLKYIHAFKPSIGAMYSLSYNKSSLLIGTNQGLYKANFDSERKTINNIQLEPRIKGQVWNISRLGNQNICGNNEETYTITDRNVEIISPVRGGICIRKGTINGQEVLVQGTYTDLCIYILVNNEWKFSNIVQGFVNPVRYIEIDYTGTIWASHLYQGLYAIKLSSDFTKTENVTEFKSLDDKIASNINVFSINNRVVFTDRTGFYTFDDIRKQIIPYTELNEKLGYFSKAYRVTHFRDDFYWFILDGEAALVQFKNNDVKIIDVVHYSLFSNQTVDDYQNIIPISANECLFTLENGLALYKHDNAKKNQNKTVLQFKTIICADAESKYVKYLPVSDKLKSKLAYKTNNITFSVFYSDFGNINNILFRFKLDGIDKVWSEPTLSAQKVYNYLPHGDYVLNAEVLTKTGVKLSDVSYGFIIKPPFYLSKLAYFVYILLFVILLIGVYFYIQHLFTVKKEKIHREQEEIRLKEIEKRENQIIALEKDKLESELTLKSKELAESTMTIIKKNEILAGIKEEVTAQKKILGSQYPNKYYDRLIKLLDDNLSSEADWAIFQANFDRIHENFFRNLHTRYPELTPNDLKFCAYLRLNLTSKDIAHLMNISLKGVEVGRYRIRKKIGLPSTKSLTEFMIEFK